jgi:hypothetical protein
MLRLDDLAGLHVAGTSCRAIPRSGATGGNGLAVLLPALHSHARHHGAQHGGGIADDRHLDLARSC